MRKPLVSLRGSMRLKLQNQIKRNMMKGKTDYAVPISGQNAEMNYLRFLGAQQEMQAQQAAKEVIQNILRF